MRALKTWNCTWVRGKLVALPLISTSSSVSLLAIELYNEAKLKDGSSAWIILLDRELRWEYRIHPQPLYLDVDSVNPY